MRQTEDLLSSVRRFTGRGPLFDLDIAQAALLLAEHQFKAQQWEEVLTGLDEVVTRYGRARRWRRRGWSSVLARAYYLRSGALSGLGRADAQLRAAEEAVERYRVLVDLAARRYATRYASALALLATSQANAGRYDDAILTAEHAARVGQRLRALGAPGMERTHASALMNLGAWLIHVRPEDGLRATDEAIGLLEELLDREPGLHEGTLENLRHNRVRLLRQLGRPEEQVLGPYPPCDHCRTNIGLPVGTRHRQVHVAANGREACVDEGLAELMPKLWSVCDTLNSCQNVADLPHGAAAKAYVVPGPGQAAAAERKLVESGFDVEHYEGSLMFQLHRST
ncbi:hypothetical protein [Actinophytocola sp.]|uniref:hypothetical protein n=1 Tax=Actinophytocola sp. TaxID=1872138 RepID=UPI003D6A67E2